MLTEKALDDLLSYRPATPVLSVYLDVDPSDPGRESHKLRLRRLLREFEDAAAADIDAIMQCDTSTPIWANCGNRIES